LVLSSDLNSVSATLGRAGGRPRRHACKTKIADVGTADRVEDAGGEISSKKKHSQKPQKTQTPIRKENTSGGGKRKSDPEGRGLESRTRKRCFRPASNARAARKELHQRRNKWDGKFENDEVTKPVRCVERTPGLSPRERARNGEGDDLPKF